MQQNEHYISTTQIIVVILWTMVGLLTAASWTVLTNGPESMVDEALMLALTASTLACVAAVAHIRLYVIKTTQLIRMTAGLAPNAPTPSPEGNLRRVH